MICRYCFENSNEHWRFYCWALEANQSPSIFSLSPFSYILTNINVILLNLKIILIFDPFWLNKYLFRSIEEFQDYSTAWRWECNNKWPNTESSLIKRMAIAA
jgi:hypothetical protein